MKYVALYGKVHGSMKTLPNNVSLTPLDYVRNLGAIFDKNLTLSQHIL